MNIILILGHRNNEKGKLSSIARERLQQGIKEYRKRPGSKMMVTGAYGPNFNTTARPHAYYLQDYLREQGVPKRDILPFVPSTNTMEDARLSRTMISHHRSTEIVVVTSDFHLPRARYLFQKAFAGYTLHFVESATIIAAEELRTLRAHEKKSLRQLKVGIS
ncbi:YdcF family protein [Candidatus Woesearchaeota archaeon]|nr:YdcF family protein [Candidatus Woesearchaeota archaeon]